MSETEIPLPKLEVGQELFVHWRANYHAHRGTKTFVTKIGRKWAELSCKQSISIEPRDGGWDMKSDGNNSPGTCYLSEEWYENIV